MNPGHPVAHIAGYGRAALEHRGRQKGSGVDCRRCQLRSDCGSPFAFGDDGFFGAVLVDPEYAHFSGADDEVDVDTALSQFSTRWLTDLMRASERGRLALGCVFDEGLPWRRREVVGRTTDAIEHTLICVVLRLLDQ
jgi:hypothetical protein